VVTADNERRRPPTKLLISGPARCRQSESAKRCIKGGKLDRLFAKKKRKITKMRLQ